MARLTTWHRRAGLAAVVGVTCWALSGVLHPIMARIQPRPAPVQAVPDPAPTAQGAGLAEVLQRHGIDTITDARIVRVAGTPHYQVTRPGQAIRSYYALDDAAEAPDGDRRHAEALARGWAGEPAAPVRSARVQERFDHEYSTVNRLLPVWRIEFERPDGMTVFVDTGGDRLGALVDERRRLSGSLFATLHRWDWLESRMPMLRLGLLSAMLVAALAATVVGVWMFFSRPGLRRGWGLRRLHRFAGLLVSIAATAFLGSGLYHLLHGGLRGDPAARLVAEPARIAPGQVRISFAEAVDRSGLVGPARVSLADIEGVVHFRVEPARPRAPSGSAHHGGARAGTSAAPTDASSHARGGEHGHPPSSSSPAGEGRTGPTAASDPHHHEHRPSGPGGGARANVAMPVYVSAMDGRVLPEGDARHARWIASRASGRAAHGEVEPVTRFGGEYGFVFKRLPVQRVALEGPDAMVVYVDTASRAVSAAIDASARREGSVFAQVHKHDWLVPLIGRDARDGLVALFAAAIAGTALMGLVLFVRTRRIPRNEERPLMRR